MRRSPARLLPFLCATPLLAQRVPEVEPNDTAATAQAVVLGTQIDCSLATGGDQDWFLFTLPANARVRMHTSTRPYNPFVLFADTRIQLFDATGTTLLGIDDNARGFFNGFTSDLTMNLAAGSYALQVFGSGSLAWGPYSIEIASITPRVYTGSEIEPNNDHLTATPTTLGAGANYFQGNLGPMTLQIAGAADGPNTIVASLATSLPSNPTSLRVAGPLVPGQYVVGFAASITSGPNLGLVRQINSNTATVISTAAFPVSNPTGTTFHVIESNTTTATRTTAALPAGAWTPATAGFGQYQLRYTSGLNNGEARQIASNTANLILVASAFLVAPASTDTFVVELVDMDYWQVVLTAPTTGIFLLITEGDAPWVSGHRFEVCDSAGVPVSAATLGDNNGLGARTSTTRVWPAGIYHVAVRSPVGPSTPTVAPALENRTGNYLLELHLMPMDTAGLVAESETIGGPNTNNAPATAVPFAPGQIGQGNITNTSGTDPSDWWGPIVISTPSTITFQTRQGVAPALLDSTINLRDAAGALVIGATEGNLLTPTSHARATVTLAPTPGTFYLEVVSPGAGATQGGSYELQLGAIVSAPYVPGSYELFEANGACGAAPFPVLSNQWTSNAEIPLTGTTFARWLGGCPPSALYLHLIGFSNSLANGAIPLPFDMAVLGAPGCTINVDPVILLTGITDATGSANLITLVPGSNVFRGSAWYEQAIVSNPAANAFGAQFSNYARAIVGDRSY